MGNVYTPIAPHIRSTDAYAQAKTLYDERRNAYVKLAEINRLLRELNEMEPEAVHVARTEVSFRKPHGRQKQIPK